ncbi:hypothetical protein StrepF001_29410 [Streptomyces sp. F001]|nr:hypothetical protein StrepF001_29410 [Streptomyces sp. F001]
MPGPLSTALVLIHVLFAFTVVGGVGLLLTAASYDVLDGGVLALAAYAAAPGTLGWWLARRTWDGGTWIWRGLVAVQAWLIIGAALNLAAGSPRGVLQLLLPTLTLFFLLRSESRQWYDLPDVGRAERRPFSLARMLRWRRDEGQTSVEYAGLVALVAALITALLVSGLGTQIYGGIRAAVCEVTGTACPAPAGDGTNARDVTAGDDSSQENNDDDGNTATEADSGDNTEGSGEDGTENNAEDSDENDREDTDGGEDDGCLSGIGAFLSCAGDGLADAGEGLIVDGVWGDVTDMYNMVRHPQDTLNGIVDYGGQLIDDWQENAEGASEMWSNGDYWGALRDWGGATLNTGGTIAFDMLIGDEAAEQWNNGDRTRAVTGILWNVGSNFIPYYNAARVVEKIGDLGSLGRLADEAAEAADDARRAAEAGDTEAARRAAQEADEAADEAEERARESGCTIAAPSRRIPYAGGDTPYGLTGSAGTGTTVLAADASSPYVVLAEGGGGGCDEEAREQAEEAREQADAADRAADEAEQGESGNGRPVNQWQAGDDVPGPASGLLLRFPHSRHTVSGAARGNVKEHNTVILRGNEGLVRADIEAIAENRATLLPDGNTYEINGRTYGVEANGTVFPKGGPGLVEMDRIEYAALQEIARHHGDASASQQLQRNPKFVNNPEKVELAQQVYDGTYR